MARRVWLGFIFPCQDMRDDYLPLVAAVGGAVEAHFAVVESVDDHDPAALARYGGRIEDLQPGIERLRPHGPDVVVYACTSGSFGCGVSYRLPNLVRRQLDGEAAAHGFSRDKSGHSGPRGSRLL